MDIKTINADLSVSPQIMPADMQAIKDAGFRSIICNRPDAEGVVQPSFAQIRNAALKVGLETVYQPIVPSEMSADDAATFHKSLTNLPGPVLAYCRTGNRSAALWNLATNAQKD